MRIPLNRLSYFALILLIGVVGEYIARIFEEVKGRPLYLIGEMINM